MNMDYPSHNIRLTSLLSNPSNKKLISSKVASRRMREMHYPRSYSHLFHDPFSKSHNVERLTRGESEEQFKGTLRKTIEKNDRVIAVNIQRRPNLLGKKIARKHRRINANK